MKSRIVFILCLTVFLSCNTTKKIQKENTECVFGGVEYISMCAMKDLFASKLDSLHSTLFVLNGAVVECEKINLKVSNIKTFEIIKYCGQTHHTMLRNVIVITTKKSGLFNRRRF